MSAGMQDIISRLAKQLLICQEVNWNAEAAKKAVKVTLTAMQVTVPRPEFRKLVACAYRVGRTLDAIDNLVKCVPWDIVGLRVTLANCSEVRAYLAEPSTFIECLASTVKSYSFTVPQTIDWVDIVTRQLRRCPDGNCILDLQTRIRIAEFVQELLAHRFEELVDYASSQLDVSVQEIFVALTTAAAEYELEPVTEPVVPTVQSSKTVGRLSQAEIDELCGVVHEKCLAEFREWIGRQPPITQRLTKRRIGQLQSEPLVYRLWVKPIHGTRVAGLSELRIIAGGTHFRVLFRRSSSSRIVILSVGLRRDLEALIERAERCDLVVSPMSQQSN